MPDIVVIDDDPDIRELLRLALGLDGHEVETAANGAEGIEVVRRACAVGRLPVVVLDVQMPDLDGWHVLERLRADETTRDCAVMLCTVKAGTADYDRGWVLGCDAYQPKPFDIGEVSEQASRLDELSIDDRWRLRYQRAAEVSA